MIAARIALHRAMYADELHIERLVARQPPTTLDLNTGELHVEDGAVIGMTMSGRLLRYLGHPEGYGSSYPWTKAKWLLRVECRRRHIAHRSAERPYWRGSLCHEAVSLTVCRGFSADNAARILKVEELDTVLTRAFRFIEERMDDFRERAEKRARDDEGRGPGAVPAPVVGHHVPSEEHVMECPNEECRARRNAA